MTITESTKNWNYLGSCSTRSQFGDGNSSRALLASLSNPITQLNCFSSTTIQIANENYFLFISCILLQNNNCSMVVTWTKTFNIQMSIFSVLNILFSIPTWVTKTFFFFFLNFEAHKQKYNNIIYLIQIQFELKFNIYPSHFSSTISNIIMNQFQFMNFMNLSRKRTNITFRFFLAPE